MPGVFGFVFISPSTFVPSLNSCAMWKLVTSGVRCGVCVTVPTPECVTTVFVLSEKVYVKLVFITLLIGVLVNWFWGLVFGDGGGSGKGMYVYWGLV